MARPLARRSVATSPTGGSDSATAPGGWPTSDGQGSNKAKQGQGDEDPPPGAWPQAGPILHRACLPDDHLLIVVASAAVVPPIACWAWCVDHRNVNHIGNLHSRLSFAAGVHYSHGPIPTSADLRWAIGCLGYLADGCVEVAGRGVSRGEEGGRGRGKETRLHVSTGPDSSGGEGARENHPVALGESHRE